MFPPISYLQSRWRGPACDHWCCLKEVLISLKFGFLAVVTTAQMQSTSVVSVRRTVTAFLFSGIWGFFARLFLKSTFTRLIATHLS